MKKYVAIMLLSVIAFVNAGYLTSRFYEIKASQSTGESFCDINATLSCSNVLAHPDADIMGVPFPAVALVVYPILFALAFLGRKNKSGKNFKILTILSGLGILFNSTFIYIETFVIHSFCPLCLLCTGIIITIFVLSLIEWRKEMKLKK